MMTIKDQIKSCVVTGTSKGCPWLAIRFRDLWARGLADVRADKMNEAMEEVLQECGINRQEVDMEDDGGYITFISPKQGTIYVDATVYWEGSRSAGRLSEAVIQALEDAAKALPD